ncbi:envelope stress response membrane protein PspC [Erythrobacter sp. EC-HK427]|uniref:envelope stress response membrane protein PspC n=1 Tax=Erythrobacter sp. EC-HK427 TaxID=2038396 RepID=UPI00125BC632|nr:envelope stress response membrane protein PspC [Erythrobacter sp. EC-HK427]VVS96779.1 putative stress-responsive transcriptional regulator [Erythrobacter sp. EC-HK427]
MNTPRTTLYRDKQNAKLLGVCSGIADYTGISIFWVRLMCIISWLTPVATVTIPAYILMGLLLNKKPPHLYAADTKETEYWQGVRQNPKRTAREIRARMKDVDRRLAEVESFYVNSNPLLTREIEQLR